MESPVTRLLKKAVKERIKEGQADLSSLGNEREYDLIVKGMIKAYTEILDWYPTEEELDAIQREFTGSSADS